MSEASILHEPYPTPAEFKRRRARNRELGLPATVSRRFWKRVPLEVASVRAFSLIDNADGSCWMIEPNEPQARVILFEPLAVGLRCNDELIPWGTDFTKATWNLMLAAERIYQNIVVNRRRTSTNGRFAFTTTSTGLVDYLGRIVDRTPQTLTINAFSAVALMGGCVMETDQHYTFPRLACQAFETAESMLIAAGRLQHLYQDHHLRSSRHER